MNPETDAWLRTAVEIASVALIVFGGVMKIEHRITALEAHLSELFTRMEWCENQIDKLWGR